MRVEPEIQIHRQQEKHKIQNCSRHRMADIKPQSLGQVRRRESPADTIWFRHIPHVRGGTAWYPGGKSVDKTPRRGKTDEKLAYLSPSGFRFENAKVLEQNGEFDGGLGEWIGYSADVEDLYYRSDGPTDRGWRDLVP